MVPDLYLRKKVPSGLSLCAAPRPRNFTLPIWAMLTSSSCEVSCQVPIMQVSTLLDGSGLAEDDPAIGMSFLLLLLMKATATIDPTIRTRTTESAISAIARVLRDFGGVGW